LFVFTSKKEEENLTDWKMIFFAGANKETLDPIK